MDSQGERKNPFLTPGTRIENSKKNEMGPLESTVFFGKVLSSLIPIASGLSFAAHSADMEIAQAAHDAWNVAQGLVVVAGLQVLQGMARESDTAMKQMRSKKN